MIEKLKALTPDSPITLQGIKKDILAVTNQLPATYIVTKVSYDKCVVVMIEGESSFTQQLYKDIESIPPFGSKDFEFSSVEYVRSLISKYNKDNGRAFKVSHREGVTTICEPFDQIESIDAGREEEFRIEFDRLLNSKLMGI